MSLARSPPRWMCVWVSLNDVTCCSIALRLRPGEHPSVDHFSLQGSKSTTDRATIGKRPCQRPGSPGNLLSTDCSRTADSSSIPSICAYDTIIKDIEKMNNQPFRVQKEDREKSHVEVRSGALNCGRESCQDGVRSGSSRLGTERNGSYRSR